MASNWTSVLIVTLVALAGCDFPQDGNGTLRRVQAQGVLRIGFTERPPWTVIENGNPAGIEARLMRAWASHLGARIEWVRGTESSLVDGLKARQLDAIVGGHTRDTVWAEAAATTQPYFRASVIIAVPPNVASPATREDLKGRTIAHVALRPDLAAMIARLGATPEAVRTVRSQTAAVYEFETGSNELTPTKVTLSKEDHVILTAPGESEFLFALDRFLARTGRQIVLAPDHLS